ncbi:MAG: CPBP family glutamic-type intramembrane protease [Terriglobales bacterium]
MNSSPDDLPKSPEPNSEPADVAPAWGRERTPVQAEYRSADTSDPSVTPDVIRVPDAESAGLIPAAPPDPAWNGWDVLRLMVLTIVALFVGVFAVLFVARIWLYPHGDLGVIAHIPLVLVAGQSVAYLLVLAYMYVLVTRERGRPDFLAAVHWNWPSNIAGYVFAGFALSLTLQALAHFLPIPKELPIDTYFRTPAEAWALGILSITLAPLMEELFFRGFLYPVLARRLGLPVAVLLTALGFALLHGSQLKFSWGPVLVIFLVGLVLTMVRAKTNSVAAGVVIHMAYNGTITVAMFAATDGFRHLERLNQ